MKNIKSFVESFLYNVNDWPYTKFIQSDHYYEEIDATKKQMISAISYPALVGIFSIVIIFFIMIKIVPQFVGIYESAGAELNPLTVWLERAVENDSPIVR